MDSIVEDNLASHVEYAYSGQLVTTKNKKPQEVQVRVSRLNSLLVRIEFDLHGQTLSFRGMLTQCDEGILMIVQEKVSDYFIISGVSGFMHEKPNVHGGFIKRLNGFYFHIMFSHFSGQFEELYFFGSKDGKSEAA